MRITPTFALFAIFLVLKLTKVIAWSWWWVSGPLWAPIPILIAWALYKELSRGKK